MEDRMFEGTGAEVFVDTLNSLGVDRIFLNPGIDLVPIMATIAGFKASQRQAPKVILCTHESVAVSAAHGYAMISGRPQFVAVFEHLGLNLFPNFDIRISNFAGSISRAKPIASDPAHRTRFLAIQ